MEGAPWKETGRIFLLRSQPARQPSTSRKTRLLVSPGLYTATRNFVPGLSRILELLLHECPAYMVEFPSLVEGSRS